MRDRPGRRTCGATLKITMNAPAFAAELWCDVPRLLQMFESLGENCDLGVVQRAVGLEPFGLFRFAACDAPCLAALLRARTRGDQHRERHESDGDANASRPTGAEFALCGDAVHCPS